MLLALAIWFVPLIQMVKHIVITLLVMMESAIRVMESATVALAREMIVSYQIVAGQIRHVTRQLEKSLLTVLIVYVFLP